MKSERTYGAHLDNFDPTSTQPFQTTNLPQQRDYPTCLKPIARGPKIPCRVLAALQSPPETHLAGKRRAERPNLDYRCWRHLKAYPAGRSSHGAVHRV